MIEPGDTVLRLMGDPPVPVLMKVHSVDDEFIYIASPPHGWKFRRDTLCEVDEDLGWDGLTLTGSRLVKRPK